MGVDAVSESDTDPDLCCRVIRVSCDDAFPDGLEVAPKSATGSRDPARASLPRSGLGRGIRPARPKRPADVPGGAQGLVSIDPGWAVLFPGPASLRASLFPGPTYFRGRPRCGASLALRTGDGTAPRRAGLNAHRKVAHPAIQIAADTITGSNPEKAT